ncbi:entericidin A/B family lipoprotein [bacterium]|nr:entericidin A/B family lipoprotein [bacterium]
MKLVFRLAALALVAALALTSLSACNTVRGVGKDVERAGEALQKSTN